MTPTYGREAERYRFATEADIEAIVEMLADPEVGRWLWFVPAPDGAIEAFFRPQLVTQAQALAHDELPSSAIFVVTDADGAFVGQGAAVEVAGSPGAIEIGYQIRREHWGRGVGRRLGEFLRAYAIFTAGAERLQAECIALNEPSRRILEGLGLRREGTRRGFRVKDTTRYDEALYGALTHDLPADEIERQARALGLRRGRL